MGAILNAILVSLVPALVLLVVVYRLDRYEPEDVLDVLFAYGLGIASFYPARSLELGAVLLIDRLAPGSGLLAMLLEDFLVYGLLEELFKLAVVVFLVMRRRYIDEPLDALIYTWIVALGFASLENFLYIHEMGSEAFIARALMATPAHPLFSGLWAWGLAHHLFRGGGVRGALVLAVMVLHSVVAHGLYDGFIDLGGGHFLWAPAILALLLGLNAVYYVHELRTSPYRFSMLPTGVRTMRRGMVDFTFGRWVRGLWFVVFSALCVAIVFGAELIVRRVFVAGHDPAALEALSRCCFTDQAAIRAHAYALLGIVGVGLLGASLAYGRLFDLKRWQAVVVPAFFCLLAVSLVIGVHDRGLAMWLKGFSEKLRPCRFEQTAYTFFAFAAYPIAGVGCLGGWLGDLWRRSARRRARSVPQ